MSKTFLPLNDPLLKNKAMPESYNLTSTLFSDSNLILFSGLFDISCVETDWVGGKPGVSAIWRVNNR